MLAAVTISWNCADQIVLCIIKYMDLFSAVTYTLYFLFNNREVKKKKKILVDLLACVTSGVPLWVLIYAQQSELCFRTHTLFTLKTLFIFAVNFSLVWDCWVYGWTHIWEILVVSLTLFGIVIYSNTMAMELRERRGIYKPIKVCEIFFSFSLELDDVLIYFLKLTNE